MLTKMIAGSLSLLAFSTAVFAGIWAGNGWSAVLYNAWWALILFLIFGSLIGWMAQVIVDEHLKKTVAEFTDQSQNPPPVASKDKAVPETTAENHP